MGYNLQDPNDLLQLRYDFEAIEPEEWQAYIDFASLGDNWKRFDKKGLYIGLNNAGNAWKLTGKQMIWALSVADAVKKEKEIAEANEQMEEKLDKEQFNQPLKHFTLRVAWHDNAWNGTICKDPIKNRYCNGFNSLLSERIRSRKEKHLQEEIDNAGLSLNEIEYLPPCFWSINIFNGDPIKVKHDNPAEPRLTPINETLQGNSMISWPYAISFSRSKKQIESEGLYPFNLDNVRAPLFREKIKRNASIAFIYSKFSNPFTEEERQYLVVGAALIKDRGELLRFNQPEIIEEKRKRQQTKYFPYTNWALQFQFDENNMVRMPYHEYLAKAEKLQDEAQKQALLDKIKVAITEPELNHCFKYVAMDIDDDEAIYILSKMRKTLADNKLEGIIEPAEIDSKIETLDRLSEHCWKIRGYFPGFIRLANLFLNRESVLNELIDLIKELGAEDQPEKLQQLIETPSSDVTYKKYKTELYDLKEALDQRDISVSQFLQLSMLNLTSYQFERILNRKVRDYDEYNYQVPTENKTPLEDVCNNPYLLSEEYLHEENKVNLNTGEELDFPIEHFKIDIAYFPNAKEIPRIDIQRSITQNDKRRLRCLIINYLSQLEQKGDCFEEASQLEVALKQYPLFYNMGREFILPTDYLKRIIADRDAFFQENNRKLKIIDANDTRYYYLDEIYTIEKKIGDNIIELLRPDVTNDLQYDSLSTYIASKVEHFKTKLGDLFNEEDFTNDRKKLYKNIFEKRLFVLAGGPGSGKSHELLNTINYLKEKGETYLLLTPTGKAALRLKSDSQFKNVEASTIDKWLSEVEYGRYSGEKINRLNNLIVDEMSMVDLIKFHDVLKQFQFSKPCFKRLILVGDPNQLPAIGYGKVLKDILYYLKSNELYKNNYIELNGNLRAELVESKVITLSSSFEESGEIDDNLESVLNKVGSDKTDLPGLNFYYWSNENELRNKIEKEFILLCKRERITGTKQEQLHQLLGLNKNGSQKNNKLPTLDNFQILTPYLAGPSGADGINDYIQREFKHDLELNLAKGLFKEYDKIIRTKNYYNYETKELQISNGSIGLIHKGGNEVLQFQESDFTEIKVRELRKNEREFFELAYAVSVHKSQGSGFDHLFIVIPQKPGLLSRELIYTALTRCRKSVSLFLQYQPDKPSQLNVLSFARGRTFTDCRKTSLLLEQPFRYYSLEPEPGVFVQSRTELMIYHELKRKREMLGSDNFDFKYEMYPVNQYGEEIKIKTDFTIYTKGKIWLWEHLGRLGIASYVRNWKTLKRPTYEKNGFSESLITTDELKGLSIDKIEIIINLIAEGEVTTEDLSNKYSFHHFSLR